MSVCLTLVVGAVGMARAQETLEGAATVDESREPPLGYVLEIGGERIPIEEGRAVRVEGTYTDPEVRLVADDFRTFPYGGISFRYPRTFLFEADLSNPEVKLWSIEGNSLTLMVYGFTAEVTAEDLIAGLAGEFGTDEPRAEPARITLGGEALEGLRWRVEIANRRLVYDIFRLPVPAEGACFLVLLDLPDGDAERSDEAERVLPMIADSFRVAPAPGSAR